MTRVRIYLILQTALCVLLVVLLSVTAVTIYREGVARKAERPLESIYTREIAAEKFAPIAPQIGPPTKAAWTVPRESSQRGRWKWRARSLPATLRVTVKMVKRMMWMVFQDFMLSLPDVLIVCPDLVTDVPFHGHV